MLNRQSHPGAPVTYCLNPTIRHGKTGKGKTVETGVAGAPQSVKHQLLISAQVMISRFVRLSPESGSVLTVWSLFGILSPSPCPSPNHAFGLSLSLSLKINKLKKKKKDQWLPGSGERAG